MNAASAWASGPIPSRSRADIPSARTASGTQIFNYDTNKTQLDEAPFGLADDDYGPGSEPPPHDRKRYVSTFMPSRRRPPAAVRKAELSSLQGLLSTSTTRAVRADTVGLS
ncbi:hypothetical protein THAOC_22841 [Thalassiosira oceanica]|uniref:Uncharacterized protein n=1 Tax=Thalassiosira oceanica TaxID=159749 RepID=K0SEX1_THAOC|nr:hypothetical protein THAOC_22841 [Thalassiosira oceanica]|eukprot:EJK57147.1 hypothetical protein THAOC_22841 [Thalassiosira oceanica]